MDQTQRIASFWKWMLGRSAQLDALSSTTNPFWNEVLEKLQTVSEGLFFQTLTDATPHEFVVTAEGSKALFPLCDAIVAAAPIIKGWEFVSLVPAQGFPKEITYEDHVLEPEKMWFMPLESKEHPEFLGLKVAVPGFCNEYKRPLSNALLVILDCALGERDAGEAINHVELCGVPVKPDEEGYIEMLDLPDYIVWKKKKRLES